MGIMSGADDEGATQGDGGCLADDVLADGAAQELSDARYDEEKHNQKAVRPASVA
ncbi:hypothetical protein [Pantoea sp. BAV 3049]|uniref:hypothetical protein n=1 Tax=Pantoea sp. BAV 3049 TaxID=2654188 RepID=UPI00131C1ACF|nr:hypothetical protein [Pantoea sp. BAV 3049]